VLHSKYEDMVLTFPVWLAALLKALRVDSEVRIQTRHEHVTPCYFCMSQKLLEYMVQMHKDSFQADGKHKRHVLPGTSCHVCSAAQPVIKSLVSSSLLSHQVLSHRVSCLLKSCLIKYASSP
jgi:hypothetical protein